MLDVTLWSFDSCWDANNKNGKPRQRKTEMKLAKTKQKQKQFSCCPIIVSTFLFLVVLNAILWSFDSCWNANHTNGKPRQWKTEIEALTMCKNWPETALLLVNQLFWDWSHQKQSETGLNRKVVAETSLLWLPVTAVQKIFQGTANSSFARGPITPKPVSYRSFDEPESSLFLAFWERNITITLRPNLPLVKLVTMIPIVQRVLNCSAIGCPGDKWETLNEFWGNSHAPGFPDGDPGSETSSIFLFFSGTQKNGKKWIRNTLLGSDFAQNESLGRTAAICWLSVGMLNLEQKTKQSKQHANYLINNPM